MVNGDAGGAEDQGVFRLEIAQHVDDRVFPVVSGNGKGPVLDIDMLFLLGGGADPHRVPLVAFGQGGDGARHGGGKQQGAAVGRRRLQDEFQIVAETQVEHFIGFVQDHRPEPGHVQRAAFDVIAQPSRRADHDMGAALQGPALVAHVHAANTRGDGGAGHFVQPFQLALDLQGQLAGRRHGQRQRGAGGGEAVGAVEQRRRQRQPEGHGFSRSRLGRHQGVGGAKFGRQDGDLHRGQLAIAAFAQRLAKRRNDAFKFCHFFFFRIGFARPGWRPLVWGTGRRRQSRRGTGRGGCVVLAGGGAVKSPPAGRCAAGLGLPAGGQGAAKRLWLRANQRK